MSVFKRTSRLLLAAIVSVSVFAIAASAASASVVYDNIPSPLPGNLASFGNEAYSMAEFGGMVEFASPAPEAPDCDGRNEHLGVPVREPCLHELL